jgi:hypothetical protein
MSEPCVPRQTQAKRLHHNEKLYDHGDSLQGQKARVRPGWDRHSILSWEGSGHDDLRLTLPWPRGHYVTT